MTVLYSETSPGAKPETVTNQAKQRYETGNYAVMRKKNESASAQISALTSPIARADASA